MGELNPGRRPLPLDEANDPPQALDMPIVVDPEILRADPPLGRHRRGLGEHQSRPADGTAPQMHEVPVGREAVHRRVLAHRRHEDPVGKTEGAQLQGLEEVGHGVYFAFPSPEVILAKPSLNSRIQCLGTEKPWPTLWSQTSSPLGTFFT